MKMASTKAISGNNKQNDSSTIFHGGNVAADSKVNVLTIAETTTNTPFGSKVHKSFDVADSGNIGAIKALDAGVFSSYEEGEYTAKVIGTRVAQTTNNLLRSGSSDYGQNRDGLHYARGNYRYDITSWDYVTGAATKGGSAGVLVTYWDPATGTTQAMEPKPTTAVPGELVYMYGSLVPSQDDYKPRSTG